MLDPSLLRLLPSLGNKALLIYSSAAGTAALVVALALLSPSAQADAGQDNAPAARHVLAATVRADAGTREVLTGAVQSDRPLEAGSLTSGRVVRLLVNIGDRVSPGQVLAVIDTTAAGLRAQQAAAEVVRAQALAAEREAAATRIASMAQGGAMSPAERDAAAAEAAAAKAGVMAAQAAARAAAHEAAQGVIRAPAAGIVAERLVQVGGVVAPGQKLFSFESSGEHVILAAAPQRMAGQLRPGQAVAYSADNASGEGTIIGISPRVADGGVAPVRIRIQSGKPLSGSVVRVSVAVNGAGSNAAVRVPASAISLGQSRESFVYGIDAGGRARRIAVQVLGFAGSEARVSGRLSPGQTVVAAGASFLSPGQRVAAAQPGL